MDVVHTLKDLAHEKLGDRMTELEITIAQKTAHVVVHVREDHKDITTMSPVRVVLWHKVSSGLMEQRQREHSLRSTTISMISTTLGWSRDLMILISRTVVTDTCSSDSGPPAPDLTNGQTHSISRIVRDELLQSDCSLGGNLDTFRNNTEQSVHVRRSV